MKSLLIAVAVTVVAALTAPASAQTKLDSGVILPKKHEDKKAKPAEKPAKKTDKKAAKK